MKRCIRTRKIRFRAHVVCERYAETFYVDGFHRGEPVHTYNEIYFLDDKTYFLIAFAAAVPIISMPALL